MPKKLPLFFVFEPSVIYVKRFRPVLEFTETKWGEHKIRTCPGKPVNAGRPGRSPLWQYDCNVSVFIEWRDVLIHAGAGTKSAVSTLLFMPPDARSQECIRSRKSKLLTYLETAEGLAAIAADLKRLAKEDNKIIHAPEGMGKTSFECNLTNKKRRP